MKKIFFLLLTITLMISCSSSKESNVNITVENPSDFDRLTEVIEIPIDDIKDRVAVRDSSVYIVKTAEGEIIPSQVTYDRKIIFQAGLKAKESKSFIITVDEPQEFPAKTYGRFIKERKDDFAWENDKVAFRIYGPALVEIDGPSNGIDIWYKRTADLIIDKWYKDDIAGTASYHNDNGEGLDDYKVGRSLGAGAMAPYIDGKLWLNENFEKQEILDNGPLRTTFKLTYKDLDVKGNKIGENRTISIDAGSHFSKILQGYTIREAIPVAAGIAKRESGDSIIAAIDKGYIIYKEPKTDKADGVYLAMVFPQGIEATAIDTYDYQNAKTNKKDSYSHVLAITTHQPKMPVVYYTGYGWSIFGFPTITDFEKYVNDFSLSLKKPFVITYTK